MKKIYILLVLAITLNSCSKTNDGSIERVFYENADLSIPADDVGMYVDWVQGDKTAIRFVFSHPEEENISDDELSEVFWIELPANVTSFQIGADDNLAYSDIELYYARSCFCYFKSFEFSKHIVSGQKIAANQWRVSFDITANSEDLEYSLKDNGVYVLTTLEN